MIERRRTDAADFQHQLAAICDARAWPLTMSVQMIPALASRLRLELSLMAAAIRLDDAGVTFLLGHDAFLSN